MTHPHSDQHHHPYRQQSVNIAGLLLTITPDSGHSLFIIGWVPVRIKHDQTVSTNEIKTTAPSFAAQHEDKIRTLGRKEEGGGVHTLLSSTTCLLSFLYTLTEDKLMCLPFSFPTHKVRFILSDPPEHKNKEIQLLTASFSTLNSYALVYLPMDY